MAPIPLPRAELLFAARSPAPCRSPRGSRCSRSRRTCHSGRGGCCRTASSRNHGICLCSQPRGAKCHECAYLHVRVRMRMGAHDDDVFMRMRAWPGLRPVPLQTLQTSLCSAPPQAPRQSWRQLLLWLASHLPQRSSLLSPKERFAQSTHALLPGEGWGHTGQDRGSACWVCFLNVILHVHVLGTVHGGYPDLLRGGCFFKTQAVSYDPSELPLHTLHRSSFTLPPACPKQSYPRLVNYRGGGGVRVLKRAFKHTCAGTNSLF